MDIPSFRLPFMIRAINSVAEGMPHCIRDEHIRPEMLLRAVERSTGEVRLLPTRVTDALEVVCRSCAQDANLHAFGRLRVFSLLEDALEQRILLERRFLDCPALARQPILPPLIVTGLFRSGTTFLHRLLSVAEGTRPLAMWELMQPFARQGQILSSRREVALKFALFRWTSSPELDAMHYARPDLPEECVVGLRLDLRSLLLWRSAPLISYHRWLLEQDLFETYRMYRRLLQHVQMSATGARLTLKAPMHLLGLRALLEVFPEAMLIQTHRDPLECVPSDHKLAFGFHGGVTAGVDPRLVVQTNTNGLFAMAERSAAIRETPQGKRIHDVAYRDLIRDPLGTVRAIHQRIGLPLSDAAEHRITAFIGANPQHKHGLNRYSIEQFGQTPAELERRFWQYRQRFVATSGDSK